MPLSTASQLSLPGRTRRVLSSIAQYRMIEFCNLAIKPEMHTADGPVLVLRNLLRQRLCAINRRHVRQQLAQSFEWQSNHNIVRRKRSGPRGDRPFTRRVIPRERLHIGVEENARSALLKKLLGAAIEFAERHGTHAHASGFS